MLIGLILGLALVVSGSILDPTTGQTRYSVSPEGVIRDSKTGLEWVVGPDEGTSYYEAEAWVKGCMISGGGWRMPTMVEMKDLYAKDFDARNIAPEFKTTGRFVWFERGSQGVGASGVGLGDLVFCINHGKCSDFRAFGLRSTCQ
jgi:hypothetical protein